MDCSTIVLASQLISLYKQIGKKKFDELFNGKNLRIGQNASVTSLIEVKRTFRINSFSNNLEKEEKKIPVGVRITFINYACHKMNENHKNYAFLKY